MNSKKQRIISNISLLFRALHDSTTKMLGPPKIALHNEY
jgi:hypothetical protein